MPTKRSYETPGSVYQTIRRHISEGSNFQYSSNVVETQVVVADKHRVLCVSTTRGLTAVFKHNQDTNACALSRAHVTAMLDGTEGAATLRCYVTTHYLQHRKTLLALHLSLDIANSF